jgi:hypothetical protein
MELLLQESFTFDEPSSATDYMQYGILVIRPFSSKVFFNAANAD